MKNNWRFVATSKEAQKLENFQKKKANNNSFKKTITLGFSTSSIKCLVE
jgi:hypothetical protein